MPLAKLQSPRSERVASVVVHYLIATDKRELEKCPAQEKFIIIFLGTWAPGHPDFTRTSKAKKNLHAKQSTAKQSRMEDNRNNNNSNIFSPKRPFMARFGTRGLIRTFVKRQRTTTFRRNARYSKYNRGFFQLKGHLSASSSAGGAIVASFPVNPALFDGANPFPEFTTLQTLYDSYKVIAVKIEWVPDKPNDTSTTTNFKPLYSAFDEDSLFVPASIGSVLEYKNSKVFPLYAMFSRFQRILPVSNTTGGSFISKDGFIDIANPQTQGSIAFYAEGLDTSDNYGQWIVTHYIQTRGRR